MRVSVLDHGYVEAVESWGSDERVIEAARMSTANGFQGWGTPDAPGDEKLLRFLWSHRHHTPFEMAGLTVEVQAPIFVFREWHRHRTQSYNELSARYTPLPAQWYVPSIERLMANAAGSNRQANRADGAVELTTARAKDFRQTLDAQSREANGWYQTFLSSGVPKELARCFLPVNQYSRMRASANLRNWLAFLSLRLPANAQWEIRQFASAVESIVSATFPRTHELFAEGMPQESSR